MHKFKGVLNWEIADLGVY